MKFIQGQKSSLLLSGKASLPTNTKILLIGYTNLFSNLKDVQKIGRIYHLSQFDKVNYVNYKFQMLVSIFL